MKKLTFIFLLSTLFMNANGQVYEQLPIDEGFESAIFQDYLQPMPNLNGNNGLVEIVNSSQVGTPSHTGTYGVYLGKSVDESNQSTRNALDMYLDLAGQSDVKLSFWIWDRIDETNDDDGLYFSDDGGNTFVKVLDFNVSNWCDEWGTLPPINVDKLAEENLLELTSTFVIRFQQIGENDANSSFGEGSDGIYIDDIEVYSAPVVYETLPFEEGFEDAFLLPHWSWSTPKNTEFPSENTVIPAGFVGVVSSSQVESPSHTGTYGVYIGKRGCDNIGISTASLDLHLNLEGQTEIEMTFWFWDRIDETNPQDGIFFSNDGGETFEKAIELDFSNWCDRYGLLPPFDIDEIAEEIGVPFSDKYVIRFQQHGDDDFNSSFGEGSDGLYIDDINIYVPEVEYAEIPFYDGFEEGFLSNNWHWATPTDTEFPSENTVTPSGFIGLVTSAQVGTPSYQGTYGLALGQGNCEQILTTNAIDLHLNIQENPIFLSFWMRDRIDETNPQDAIYISVDGGENFEKIYSLDPSNLLTEDWQLFELNLTDLALDEGLNLSETTIVRFQQQGQFDFNSQFGDGSDGIYIDEINVGTESITSVEELKHTTLQIYPNPASEFINIQSSDIEIDRIEIYHLNGQKVYSENNVGQVKTINIQQFTKGMYLLNLFVGNESKSFKINVK